MRHYREMTCCVPVIRTVVIIALNDGGGARVYTCPGLAVCTAIAFEVRDDGPETLDAAREHDAVLAEFPECGVVFVNPVEGQPETTLGHTAPLRVVACPWSEAEDNIRLGPAIAAVQREAHERAAQASRARLYQPVAE